MYVCARVFMYVCSLYNCYYLTFGIIVTITFRLKCNFCTNGFSFSENDTHDYKFSNFNIYFCHKCTISIYLVIVKSYIAFCIMQKIIIK